MVFLFSFVFFFFRFAPGAPSFWSYFQDGCGESNLGAAAQTTRVSPPKDERVTPKQLGGSINWFVKKRKEIPLDYFSYCRRPVRVPPGYVRTSTALVPRQDVDDYHEVGSIGWRMLHQPRDRHRFVPLLQ